ncbi:hypothetical protein E2566_21380 [Pectobacterium punjabense]|uniref:Uncharacterized protein n=1 Tax=Pectobacterium punjabense TaxID=2108399 RepID=A0ABX6L9S9_9GAMM|nr:hypothetical protein [Pectobacterium punjabense]MBS4431465.1 hypothetical protein [Pectobacterium punjabense]PTA64243.1 hypothetical protein C9I36_11085 [Pectobacterium punjabense]QJA22282.1 hypothetical protein E2566_21380 [Pectobacterium punjabense]
MSNDINGFSRLQGVDNTWKIQRDKKNGVFNEILKTATDEYNKKNNSSVSLVSAQTGKNVFNVFIENFTNNKLDVSTEINGSKNLSKEEKFILNGANSLLRNRIIFNKYISQLENPESRIGTVTFVKI